MKKSNQKPGSIFDLIRGHKESTVIIVTIVLFVFVSITKTEMFLSGDNMRTTLIGMSCNGIIGIGMTLALICGGFDLSVGSVMGLTAVLVALFASMDINVWVAFVLAMLVAGVIGLANGLLIGKVGLSPFVTTLGMMSIGRGLVLVITNGQSLSVNGIENIEAFRFLGTGSVGPVPMIVIIFIILAIISHLMFKKSSAVMKVFYVGSSEKSAKLSGINVSKVKILVYIFSAIMSGLAGVLSLSRFGTATVNLGQGVEMNVISAAVIGGAGLSGGEGSVLGTVLGVFMLSIINNALVLFNVSVNWQNLISGVILIVAVTFDTLSHKKKVKKIAA